MAVIAASTLASCGESVLAAEEDGDRRGKARAGATHRVDGEDAKAGSKAQREQRAGDRAGEGSTKTVETAVEKSGRDTPRTQAEPSASSDGGGPGSGRAEAAVSCADDLARDLEGAGSMPSYADLRRGCVREDGDQIVLAATTVGSLPARMPDRNTNFAVGFELTTPSGDTVYVGAESTTDGWSAYLSEGGASRAIGGPTVSGNQVVIAVRAAELGDGRLSWNVESSWLRSTLTTTEYAFDDAPNGAAASFDRR